MKTNVRLEIAQASFAYGPMPTLQDINIQVKKGEFVGIIGPNGSGKSTLLKLIYKALILDEGTIMLDGEDMKNFPFRKLSRKVAVVGQEQQIPFDFKVKDIVSMGRNPYKGLFDSDTTKDCDIIREAMERIGLSKMADCSYQQLSGGEKQRVVLARALAQQSDFLVLDEPTNHLDIHCQLSILDRIKRLNITVIAALHDLNLAALYCDRIYLLTQGKNYVHGLPEKVLTKEHIMHAYNVETLVRRSAATGKINIEYLPRGIQIEETGKERVG